MSRLRGARERLGDLRSVILFTTAGQPQIEQYAHPNLGRLVQPRHYPRIAETAAQGIPWAADNDAFNGEWDEDAFERMLQSCAHLPGCRFVVARDVVGDAYMTSMHWEEYASLIMRYGLPCAYVAQDGIESIEDVPWGSLDALFIGGTDDFKLGSIVPSLVAEAKRRGKWVHMGRVNSKRRVIYAASIGCDSIDGSSFSRWRARWLPEGLAWVVEAERVKDQLALEGMALDG
jgi:hypothetical protein